jgi:micrococcal nuclease
VTYAELIEITDGDTIRVQFEDGTTARVRYIGMDTPETGDALSIAATDRNSELAAGKTAMLVKDVSEVDRFDRLLRYVIVQGVFINYELVRQGYAWAKSYPPDTACDAAFRQVQTSAQSAQIGVWAPFPLPLPTVASRSETIDPGPAACSCTGNIYNCDAFSTHAQAQSCFDYCVSVGAGDVHRLDGDGDGSACESLP